MTIEKLKAYSGEKALQLCQCIGIVTLSDGSSRVLVYDSSNGHWLDPAKDMEEVGYLSDFDRGRAAMITKISVPNAS